MRFLFFVLLFPGLLFPGLLVPWSAAAQLVEAPQIPELNVTVTPTSTLETHGYVQGQLVLDIQLISRHPFEALSVPSPVVDNADVIQLTRPRTRRISGYAGEGHVFQSAYAVIPRQAGTLHIPAVRAVGVVEPVKDEELQFDVASAPLAIAISGPPEDYNADWWLAAAWIEVDESWSPPVDTLRVSAPAQRKVSLRAWGVSDAHLPTLSHPPAQGVNISLRSVETRTETSSDGLIAYADYVWDIEAQREQVVFLKPIGVTYWDPISHRRRVASAPGHRIEPLPADAERLARDLMAEARAARGASVAWVLAIALALASPILIGAATAAYAALPTREDMRLRRACDPGATPQSVYAAVDDWRVASGLGAADMTREMPARQALSDQLFARDHPQTDTTRRLRNEALAWSRRSRLADMITRVRQFL